MTIMFSYGMNTNITQMNIRCPLAENLGVAILPEYSLEFRKHANVVPNDNHKVYGVLWKLTESDEQALDRLEGYPTAYNKQTLTVYQDGKSIQAMTYVINTDLKQGPPSEYYYSMLKEGYEQHGIPLVQIEQALELHKKYAELSSY